MAGPAQGDGIEDRQVINGVRDDEVVTASMERSWEGRSGVGIIVIQLFAPSANNSTNCPQSSTPGYAMPSDQSTEIEEHRNNCESLRCCEIQEHPPPIYKYPQIRSKIEWATALRFEVQIMHRKSAENPCASARGQGFPPHSIPVPYRTALESNAESL